MKCFLTIFITLFYFSSDSYGQISIEPSALADTITVDEEGEFKLKVTNTDSLNGYRIWWKVVRGSNWKEDWKVIVCDDLLCYPPGTFATPETKPNSFPPSYQSEAWSIKVQPNGVAGISTLQLELYSDKDFTNKIGDTQADAIFKVEGPSSTVEEATASISLFPNPSNDYFSVKNDDKVAKITLLNLWGSEVWTKTHQANASYDIRDLYKGIYLVQLIDANGRLIKTMRLNKVVN